MELVSMMDSEENFPELLGFGAVAIDELLYLEKYPPVNTKMRVKRRLRQGGGLTGTALVTAARLGVRCGYVGQLGEDPLSREMIDRLEQEGVDCSRRAKIEEARPGYSTILVEIPTGHRTVLSCTSRDHFGAAPRWPEAEMIERASAIHIDHHGVIGSLRAARLARKKGIPVIADFERPVPSEEFRLLLEEVDHLIVSETFARQVTGEKVFSNMLETLWNDQRQLVAITHGDRGCSYRSRASIDTFEHMDCFSVDVVDSTGCGDVFHGGYAAGILRGLSFHHALLLANAAAAMKATRPGGQSGIPTREEVFAFLEAHDISIPRF
jgi:sugar/nucleoside kinase (ribokinase family)